MTRPGAVLLAGATGLVGGEVLARLLARPAGPRVVAPVRRPLPVRHTRLLAPVLPLADPAADAELSACLRDLDPPVATFVCCLGTTIRAAGSREAFLAVDRDLVLRLGVVARSAGAGHAILVSSVGASAQSDTFYLRVKGEAERGLAELGFGRVDILRPGLLLGARDEHRPGEALARRLAPFLNPLLVGGLRRYRAIAAAEVAAAAVALSDEAAEGRYVYEYAALRSLAAR